MILRPLAAAAAVCCIHCTGAAAQQPLSIGTAAGLGDAAVTEARRTDALLWNPALLGVYDGPLASYTVLAVDADALPARSWRGPAHTLGLDGLPPRAGWMAPGIRGTGAGVAAGRVQWFATQHRDFALGLSTHYQAAGSIPEPIARSLGGESRFEAPVAADSTLRSAVTVLAVGRGAHVGDLPLLGALWLGATAKGWWVHSYGRGAFLAGEPGEDVYRETVIRDVPGYGLDLGILAQPVDRVRFGASVSNAISGVFRPGKGPRVRVVSILPAAGGGADVTVTQTPHLGTDDEDTEDARRARALWESLAHDAVLRVGTTVETDVGSVAASVRTRLREGGVDPAVGDTPYTLAFAGTAVLPLHLSYGWGGEGSSVSAGVRLGRCERRWSVAITRRSAPWGTTYGMSGAVTVGSAAGCDLFR
jgi:hypothetical protein